MPNFYLVIHIGSIYIKFTLHISFILTKVNIIKTFNKYNYVKDIFQNYGVFNTLHNAKSDRA